MVAIAGPQSDLLPQEIDKLKAYVTKGGKLLVLIDPPQKADAPPLSNLIAFLKEWSVEVGNNAVLDPMSQLRGTIRGRTRSRRSIPITRSPARSAI